MMSPFHGHARLLAPLVVGALLLPASALGGTAGGPTKTTWATAANRACTAAYVKIRALPKPTSPKLYTSDVRGTLRIGNALDRELAQIPAPRSEQHAISRLLTISRSSSSLIERRLLPALAVGDQSGALRLGAQLDVLGKQYNALARSLGAVVCAENPEPQG